MSESSARRDLLFGITLTEIIIILFFMLLLVMAAQLSISESKQQADVPEEPKIPVQVLYDIMGWPYNPEDPVSELVAVDRLNELKKKIAETEERERESIDKDSRIQDLVAEVDELTEENRMLKDVVASLQPDTPDTTDPGTGPGCSGSKMECAASCWALSEAPSEGAPYDYTFDIGVCGSDLLVQRASGRKQYDETDFAGIPGALSIVERRRFNFEEFQAQFAAITEYGFKQKPESCKYWARVIDLNTKKHQWDMTHKVVSNYLGFYLLVEPGESSSSYSDWKKYRDLFGEDKLCGAE